MNKRWHIAALGALIWLLFHFAMTSIYSMDFAPVGRSVRAVSQAYSVPLFHQNWSMFAPEVPGYALALEYRFGDSLENVSWQGVSSSMHFSRNSKVYYMEQSICSGLASEIGRNMYFENGQRQLGTVLKSFDYSKAVFYVHQLHTMNHNEKRPKKIQLRLLFHFTPELGSSSPAASDTLVFPEYQTPQDVH